MINFNFRLTSNYRSIYNLWLLVFHQIIYFAKFPEKTETSLRHISHFTMSHYTFQLSLIGRVLSGKNGKNKQNRGKNIMTHRDMKNVSPPLLHAVLCRF